MKQHFLSGFEQWLLGVFESAPHLPHNARKTIADIAPWLALIFGVLGLISILSAGMFVSMLSLTYFAGGFIPVILFVGMAAAVVSCGLEIAAFAPLRAGKKQGWNLLFFATTLSFVVTIFNILMGYGSVMSVLFSIIGLWLLFEVRDMFAK